MSPDPTERPSADSTAPAAHPYRTILLVNPPMAAIGAEFMMEDVPLRLEYLAAYVRGHVDRVEVLDLANGKGRLETTLAKLKPDLVGISINYVSTHRNGIALAKIVKRSGAKVVVGGYMATAMVEELAQNPDIDFVARGEGEATFLDLVQGNPVDGILGLSYRRGGVVVHNEDRPLIADLDSLPFPERTRRDRKYRLPFADLDGNVATAYDMIITSRGCWGRCTFCTEPIMSHGKQRYRKPEKIIEELEEILTLHRGKRLRVHIADANFGGNPRIAEDLCDRLIELRARCGVDLHFFLSLRPSTVANNPRLAKKMIAAGIDYLFVGMESPHPEDLKAVSKRGESQEKQERAVRYLQEAGAEIMSNLLIGLPGQTPESILGLVDYAKKLELADCYFSVVTPLPGSKLYDEAVAKDLLVEKDPTKFRLYDIVMKHDTLTRGKVREMCVRANAKWYDDLMLKAEHRRCRANGGRKRRLYDFAGKFGVLVNFFTFIGSGADKEFAELDPALFVKDMPNPGLRTFTEEHGMHRFLEMARFLRILGEQRIHVTLKVRSEDVVTWVAKTTPTTVEYLAAVPGAPAETPSIAINIAMDPGALTGAKVLQRVLADNPGARGRFNLLRLAAAAGSEVASSYAARAVEATRSRIGDALASARGWLPGTRSSSVVQAPAAWRVAAVGERVGAAAAQPVAATPRTSESACRPEA